MWKLECTEKTFSHYFTHSTKKFLKTFENVCKDDELGIPVIKNGLISSTKEESLKALMLSDFQGCLTVTNTVFFSSKKKLRYSKWAKDSFNRLHLHILTIMFLTSLTTDNYNQMKALFPICQNAFRIKQICKSMWEVCSRCLSKDNVSAFDKT